MSRFSICVLSLAFASGTLGTVLRQDGSSEATPFAAEFVADIAAPTLEPETSEAGIFDPAAFEPEASGEPDFSFAPSASLEPDALFPGSSNEPDASFEPEDSPLEPFASAEPSAEADPGKIATPLDDILFASPEGEDDLSSCFPAGATVEKEDGSAIRMDELEIGDRIKVGTGAFSPVFLFTHREAAVERSFIVLRTASEEIRLTKGHYIYAGGAMKPAGEIVVGDLLTLGSGRDEAVVDVGSTKDVGLFNPQTVAGDVVVSNVVASTYTSAFEPVLAHAILAPLRALGWGLGGLENGSEGIRRMAPRGKALY